MPALQLVSDLEPTPNPADFVRAIEFPKSGPVAEAIDELAKRVRKHKLGYKQLCDIFEGVRKKEDLRRPKRERTLPQLLSEAELHQFFGVIKNVEHEVMMRFLLYTAIRVNELINVKVEHLDLGNCTARIEQGKGAKDRYVLFPASLRLVLSNYLQAHPTHAYLFESRQYKKYSPRRIQQIMREYGQKAGLGNRVHPHLFRHQFLTFATRSGLTDAQIQLISGHSSKKSLEVYQHLSLVDVEQAYQQAVKGMVV